MPPRLPGAGLWRKLRTYARDLRTFPGDALAGWRGEGAAGVWEELRRRTFDRVFRLARLRVIEHDLREVPELPPPPGVRIQVFDGDWSRFASFAGPRRLGILRRAAASSRLCLVAWRGDRPVGFARLADRLDPGFDLAWTELPSGTAYVSDLYVPPPERSGGIGSALAAARLQRARALGFQRAWRMVAPGNRPSLRTVAKTAGTRPRIVGQVLSVKVLSRRFVRFTPAPPGEALTGSSPTIA